ncbi:DUF6454 family protein [Streptomyces sp. NBC_01408]|uniref:DUF6454 family protein n=1 Tax=Streptomyces sp. NBC_01408 TaxID=2903855 RepID=UPI002250898A|nr:DUF6454 family protein [Streptomyces sp. NBC_01408]MCX4692379.1 DUF6454 family protein [Streptomyces sp. NBC_01408]
MSLPYGPSVVGVCDDSNEAVIAAVRQLTRGTAWSVINRVPLEFPAHHPQGVVRGSDRRLYLSSAEIIEPTRFYGSPVDGFDRTPGQGIGHLFVTDPDGGALGHVTVGEDAVYHPGGIDFDGESVWVPAAEYRPHSRSIVYRVDPDTLEVREAFRFDDHIGGVVRDRQSGLLHAVTWGSRSLLTFTPDGRLTHRVDNKSHFVDYQTCVSVGGGHMVCTGIAEYPVPGAGVFSLGGIAVVDVDSGRIEHEAPMTELSPAGRVVTYNAVHLETDGSVLRMFAVPDDGASAGDAHLLTLETTLA